MLQLAEETLGIPCLITEKDLMIKYPNIMLAMLVYLICVKHSVDSIDPSEFFFFPMVNHQSNFY